VRVLDLFSGIGGFSLGLERAGLRTVAFCEIDPYCRAVLAKHWPNVPCYDDVRELQAIGADVVCGGPPCTETSVAAAIQGRRTGATLWPAMHAVIRRNRPQWIIVEQPAGTGGWAATVKNDLASIGYHSARLQRSARDCGAPHERRRLFIVANTVRERCEAVAWLTDPSAIEPCAWPAPPRGTWREAGAGNRGMDDGISNRMDRLRALGNSLVPQIAEIIGRAIMAQEGEANEAAATTSFRTGVKNEE
jgi:DNA (cytosine-5)-methyltransferase 1